MPRRKANPLPLKENSSFETPDTVAPTREERLFDLLKWVAGRIRTLNANGRVSDRVCVLCGGKRLLRNPGRCRHSELWALVDGDSTQKT